mmetsp:Transcript_25882/g.79592  ORF Transcript_25882/g.79592 Transcript_25882/m.79592 type:complete len:210 (+) Transcript_25882:2145-2774(+)
MSLEAIDFSCDGCPTDCYAPALDNMLRGTPCGASLRELCLHGNELSRVPECFRGLQLTNLDLTFSNLRELPEWISDMPLIVLNLRFNALLAELPQSLHEVRTLRVLDLDGTELSGPHYDPDEEGCPLGINYYSTGRHFVPVTDAAVAGELARRETILRGLSLAVPELRIKTAGTEAWSGSTSELNDPTKKVWWHAACGHDWTDSIFYEE